MSWGLSLVQVNSFSIPFEDENEWLKMVRLEQEVLLFTLWLSGSLVHLVSCGWLSKCSFLLLLVGATSEPAVRPEQNIIQRGGGGLKLAQLVI